MKRLLIVVCCLSSLLLCACRVARQTQLGKTYTTSVPLFTLNAIRMADSTVKLTFVSPSRIRTSDPIIRWVEATVGASEDMITDTVVFTTSQSGAPGVDQTVHLVGYTSWTTPQAKSATKVYANVRAQTASEMVKFKQVVDITAASPVTLEGFTQPAVNNTIDIGVTVRRIFLPTGEFLPTTEAIRVIVSDEDGQVIWRSDVGKVFQQRVGLVQPQRIDEVQRFSENWDGTDLQGIKVASGTYTAEVIIPSKPRPYTTTFAFAWAQK